MKKILAAFICFIIVASIIADGSAIIVSMPEYHIYPNEHLVDSIPPSAPHIQLDGIKRGHGTVSIGNHISAPADREFGSIAFEVSGAVDNRTPEDSLGYRLYLVNGELPKGLIISSKAYFPRKIKDVKYYYFHWLDGNTWNQDPFRFSVALSAVDRGGNESALSNIVIVQHDGDLSKIKELQTERFRKKLFEAQTKRDSTSLTVKDSLITK